jgi:hypothetical protein
MAAVLARAGVVGIFETTSLERLVGGGLGVAQRAGQQPRTTASADRQGRELAPGQDEVAQRLTSSGLKDVDNPLVVAFVVSADNQQPLGTGPSSPASGWLKAATLRRGENSAGPVGCPGLQLPQHGVDRSARAMRTMPAPPPNGTIVDTKVWCRSSLENSRGVGAGGTRAVPAALRTPEDAGREIRLTALPGKSVSRSIRIDLKSTHPAIQESPVGQRETHRPASASGVVMPCLLEDVERTVSVG